MLIIMDGVGLNPSRKDNAVALARTPNLDRIYSSYPTTVLEASGIPVGLPEGQMGNSEVGHLTLGAGAKLRQDLVKINESIDDGSMAKNPAVLDALKRASDTGLINLVGLVSDGGVHSHVDHLVALIEVCKNQGVIPRLHMITDGRDTAPQCATSYLDAVEPALQSAGGSIVTVCGRYYAMDRDNRWERVEQAWQLMIKGHGATAESARAGIESAWQAGETDEFIKPILLPDYSVADAGGEWLFFNFRNDRPRELSEALAATEFDGFDREEFSPVSLTTLTRYHADYPFPVAFEKEVPDTTIGEIVSDAGITQLRSAETEKYPHVTFFFSGGREDPFPHETRLLVDSPDVATYDLKPEMSAYGIRDGILDALAKEDQGMIIVNFANGDMVGHTGVREAVIRSVEVVDECVGALCDAAEKHNCSVLVTADHGNADMLLDPVTGAAHTQHTTFPVPCAVIDKSAWRLGNGHDLTSIAPTMLQLMGIAQPAKMSGRSFLLEEIDTDA